MKIHYNLIGTLPGMEQYRCTLPELINRYQQYRSEADGCIIIACAAHFYGLSWALDYQTVEELILDIQELDHQLEVA